MSENWTAAQLRFQEWLATPRVSRTPPTQEMLADELGISDRTLTRWQALEGWQEAVNALARKSLGKRLPDIYGALIREAEKGNYQHIQLIFEMTGDYVKQQKNMNQSEVKADVTLRFIDEEVGTDDDL